MAAKKSSSKRSPRRAPARSKRTRTSTATRGPKHAAPQAQPADASGPFVVGIGASAGGLEALEGLFDAMPSDTGMAFVVATHQHPSHSTLLPELLARRTTMPVTSVRDLTRLEANHVYVSVPSKNIALLHGTIQLIDVVPEHELQRPIDYFFRSLADDQGERAICIVLSGTGTDGTLGLRAVKGQSGMAIVQDEASAHYPGMPHSAAGTQLADYVLAPARMPEQLLAYARASAHGTQVHESLETELSSAVPKIFVLLRNHTGHDFSGYKLNTMQRRIERRMRVHQLTRPDDYVRLLQTGPHELDLLFQELLITVTQFFREPQAFEALARALRARIDAQQEPALRIWVAACSTGEEAYSIAMLCLELAEQAGKHVQLQIFATDLDPRAIDAARAGCYPDGIAADVGPKRLARFFIAEGKGYRVHKRVRDCIVFATQNVLRDPPFTRLDLLSCRNLLIYLTAPLQQRLFQLFHYALKPRGILLLGSSENVSSADQFAALDRKWKLYSRRGAAGGALGALDLGRPRKPKPVDAAALPVESPPRNRRVSAPLQGIAQSLEELLIRRFAPATLLVTERGDIAYIHGRTGAYLEPSVGEPRHNLFAMARNGLRVPLQSAIRAASIDEREIILRGISIKGRDGTKQVSVVIRRITDPEPIRGLFRVSFFAAAPPSASRSKPAKKRGRSSAARYDDELTHARESLGGTLEALQTANEELKSANEELQSTNEELQSANEELDTSKEELQSLNEELRTQAVELQLKVDELGQVNDDMQNLLNGTDIATLFLDRQLRIKRFTEQARRVVRLIATDVGRPIGDLVPQVRYEHLTEHATRVLQTLSPHETEVQTLEGHWLLVRILPYRTGQNVIDGVVIMFVDIDRLKRAELSAASNALAESIVQAAREPLVVLDRDFRIVTANRAFSQLLGLVREEARGQLFFDLSASLSAVSDLRRLLDGVLTDGKSVEGFEFSYKSAEAEPRTIYLDARRLDAMGAYPATVLLVFGISQTS